MRKKELAKSDGSLSHSEPSRRLPMDTAGLTPMAVGRDASIAHRFYPYPAISVQTQAGLDRSFK